MGPTNHHYDRRDHDIEATLCMVDVYLQPTREGFLREKPLILGDILVTAVRRNPGNSGDAHCNHCFMTIVSSQTLIHTVSKVSENLA